MILRSQNQKQLIQSSKPQPISIRDIMRQHDLSAQVENNNSSNILPPSLTNPYYQPQSILKNSLEANMPAYVPSHIQSEPSIQLPDPREEFRQRSPRRRKIFQKQLSHTPKLQTSLSTPANVKSNQVPSSFGTTPQFTPLQLTPSMPRKQQQPKPYESFSSPHHNSSGTLYNTIPSMRMTTDHKNNTIYEQPISNFGFEPSGISLRSKHSANQSQDIKRTNSSIFKNTNTGSPNLNTRTSQKPELLNQSTSSLNRLSRNVSLNSPVPVYESKFYKNDQQKGEAVLHNLFQHIPLDRVVNSFQPNLANTSEPQQNQILNTMIRDYKEYQARESSPSYPSFGNISSNQNNRPISSTQPFLARSAPTKNFNVMSPFQQTQRQQLEFIPKRFEQIQNKVKQHENQLMHLNQKLAEAQLNDLMSQKTLLNQLIKKQQQLNLKQREINSNLEQITKMQIDSNLKKQQILKYELQIQQAKRLQDLHKENERLYHQLLRKDKNILHHHRRDSKENSYEFEQKRSFMKNENSLEWSFDRFDNLLSPFAIKPQHY